MKNIKEYNINYHKDGTIEWKRIGEMVGNHPRRKKNFPSIDITKIAITEGFHIDESILEQSRALYAQTQEMIPVFLSFDFRLIGGHEQYVLAKELGLKKIPAQRITKPNETEKKELRNSVSNKKVANKKYPVKANDGSKIFVSLNRVKKVKELIHQADSLGYSVEVLPDFRFSLVGKNNTSVVATLNEARKIIADLSRKRRVGDRR